MHARSVNADTHSHYHTHTRTQSNAHAHNGAVRGRWRGKHIHWKPLAPEPRLATCGKGWALGEMCRKEENVSGGIDAAACADLSFQGDMDRFAQRKPSASSSLSPPPTLNTF